MPVASTVVGEVGEILALWEGLVRDTPNTRSLELRVELEVGGDGLRCDLGAALRHAKLHPLSLSLSLSLPFDKIR